MEPLKGHGGGINSVGGLFLRCLATLLNFITKTNCIHLEIFAFHVQSQLVLWENANIFERESKKIAKESLYLCEGMQNNLKNIISYHH